MYWKVLSLLRLSRVKFVFLFLTIIPKRDNKMLPVLFYLMEVRFIFKIIVLKYFDPVGCNYWLKNWIVIWGALKQFLINELKFGTKVYINKLHIFSVFQVQNVHWQTVHKNLQKVFTFSYFKFYRFQTTENFCVKFQLQ